MYHRQQVLYYNLFCNQIYMNFRKPLGAAAGPVNVAPVQIAPLNVPPQPVPPVDIPPIQIAPIVLEPVAINPVAGLLRFKIFNVKKFR